MVILHHSHRPCANRCSMPNASTTPAPSLVRALLFLPLRTATADSSSAASSLLPFSHFFSSLGCFRGSYRKSSMSEPCSATLCCVFFSNLSDTCKQYNLHKKSQECDRSKNVHNCDMWWEVSRCHVNRGYHTKLMSRTWLPSNVIQQRTNVA